MRIGGRLCIPRCPPKPVCEPPNLVRSSAKATVRSNNGGDNWPLASGARRPAAPSHAAWRRFCGRCGRTKRRSTRVYPPRIPRTTRSVTVPYSNPSTWCSAYPTLSRSTDRGRNLDCTHSSSSILCPGNIGPTKSTYRWVSRGSSKAIHRAPIPLFSPTKRVSVHGGSCSIDNSRSIDGRVTRSSWLTSREGQRFEERQACTDRRGHLAHGLAERRCREPGAHPLRPHAPNAKPAPAIG